MTKSQQKKLTIDVISEDGERLSDVFISVISGEYADHERSRDGSVTFVHEFKSPVEVTVHHCEYVPRMKTVTVSSKHVRQSVRLSDLTYNLPQGEM